MQEGLWQNFAQPLATWFCFIFVFCWQALKGVLIRGLLILLRRSIQPAAQKKLLPALLLRMAAVAQEHQVLPWSQGWTIVVHSQQSLQPSSSFACPLHLWRAAVCRLVSWWYCTLAVSPLWIFELSSNVKWWINFKVVILLCAFQSYMVGLHYLKDCFLKLQPEECLLSDVTPSIFPPLYWLWGRGGEMFTSWTLPQPFSCIFGLSSAVWPKWPCSRRCRFTTVWTPSFLAVPAFSLALELAHSWFRTSHHTHPSLQTKPQKIKELSAGLSPQSGFSQQLTSSATSSKDVVVGAESVDKEGMIAQP